MKTIYITGHKNPDMDSVCSAYCYAKLKQKIDPDINYIPVRCGHLNKATKQLFQQLGAIPPDFLKDLRPTVKEIVKSEKKQFHVHDPVYEIIRMLNERTVSVSPVFDDLDNFVGLISVDEVTGFFLREHAKDRPKYHFRIDNFQRVVPGEFIKRGENNTFDAQLMTGAMPIEVSRKRIEKILPDKPVIIVGMRREVVDYAVEHQFPAIILTGYSPGEYPEYDFSVFKGTVYLSHLDTAETIRRLRLSLPVRNLLNEDIPRVKASEFFDDVKEMFINSEYRGLPVFEGDTCIGYITRRSFIDRPKKYVILMDHNEYRQSIRGIEDAEVVEIIDHHRLALEKTRYPIYVASSPVGSTCTLVYEHYKKHQVTINPVIAKLLLGGILSDTVMLKSPTATSLDRHIVKELANIAEISDIQAFGEEIFKGGLVLTEEDPESIITADFKIYDEYGCKFGIGQVEVITLENVEEVKEKLLYSLEQIKLKRGLSWVMLLITNVIKENSILLTTPYQGIENKLMYKMEENGKFLLPGILSRKKQLLPEILRVLEEQQGR